MISCQHFISTSSSSNASTLCWQCGQPWLWVYARGEALEHLIWGEMINVHVHEYMGTEWGEGRHEVLEVSIRRHEGLTDVTPWIHRGWSVSEDRWKWTQKTRLSWHTTSLLQWCGSYFGGGITADPGVVQKDWRSSSFKEENVSLLALPVQRWLLLGVPRWRYDQLPPAGFWHGYSLSQLPQ